ncbi:MAG: hypothetical protein R3C46_07410 [Hyphomonadaceae bacterium]
MGFLVDNMQWVLLACGLLTASMAQAVFAPRATVRAYFGEAAESRQFDLIIRNWGMLITAGGGLLIYAAFTPEIRPAALIMVGATKIAFVALMLGSGVMQRQAKVALAADAIMIALFAAYLLATLGQAS